MLRILFSPSEGKNTGGSQQELRLLGGVEARKNILDRYNKIVLGEDQESIQKLFGFKKFSECAPYIADVYTAPKMKAIKRYSGVAFEYLQYEELDANAQAHLDARVILFSNLFGPVRADDMIPIYKVKQGNSIDDIKPELYYKERFSYQLDLLLAQDEILDLRAGYYEKFYKTKRPYTTLKFLKDGKVVSHWAKAYRGIVLREMAKNGIDDLQSFQKMEIDNLLIKEIKEQKNKTEIVYEIVS